MTRRRLALVVALATGACADPAAELGAMPGDPDGPGIRVAPDFPPPPARCAVGPNAPTRLVLTTTDFSTGALTEVELQTNEVRPDVGPSTTDAIPFYVDGRIVVVHRFGFDRIDLFDPADWTLRAQVALPPASAAVGTNPHTAFAGPGGSLWITAFGEPVLRRIDPTAVPADAVVGQIDLSPVADDDGNPDASLAVACGELAYVVTQRVDAGFRPRGEDALVAVDLAAGELRDADRSTPEIEGLRTLGTWVRQVRADPADPDGTTLLALSTGIERIDLAAGEVTWAVAASRFVAADLADYLQPQSFDLDADGTLAYLAAYDPDFSQVRLYRVGLDDHAPEVPEPFADGFDSVDHTLEVVGDVLWYASNRAEAPGLWRFDLGVDPPLADGAPHPTGLPPYSMVALP